MILCVVCMEHFSCEFVQRALIISVCSYKFRLEISLLRNANAGFRQIRSTNSNLENIVFWYKHWKSNWVTWTGASVGRCLRLLFWIPAGSGALHGLVIRIKENLSRGDVRKLSGSPGLQKSMKSCLLCVLYFRWIC